MTGSAFSEGWWSGWIRCSWSAFTSSAAVSAILPSSRSRVVTGRASPAVVAVRDRDGAVLRSAIPVHPRPCTPPARERHGRRATVEIVTLLAIEGVENFLSIDPVHLAAHRSLAIDQTRIRPEVEQSPAHAARASTGCSAYPRISVPYANNSGGGGVGVRDRGTGSPSETRTRLARRVLAWSRMGNCLEHGTEEVLLGHGPLELHAVVDDDLRHTHHVVGARQLGELRRLDRGRPDPVGGDRHVLSQAHGPGAVGSGRRREDLDVHVGGECPERGERLLAQRRLSGRHHDDRVDEIAELVARGNAVEPDPVVGVGALHDDRRHLVDAVLRGAFAIEREVEDLHGDLVGELGYLADERFVLAAEVAGQELLREDDELHGAGALLDPIADGGAVALGQDGHGVIIPACSRCRLRAAVSGTVVALRLLP